MPSSKATFREVGAITIVDLSGMFMLGESSAVLRKAILDLLNPPKKVCEMLELTQLSKIFQVYADEPSALRSFD